MGSRLLFALLLLSTSFMVGSFVLLAALLLAPEAPLPPPCDSIFGGGGLPGAPTPG